VKVSCSPSLRSDSSVLDAASNGASQGINLILNIIANLVAFVAIIAFIDGMFKWVTYLVGFDDVGIQFVLGKIFIPISWALGVDWVDCEAVGNVIGTKTIINEFVAYQLLGSYKDAGTISVSLLEGSNHITLICFSLSSDPLPLQLMRFAVSPIQARWES
jgi:nucleoside permease NupC